MFLIIFYLATSIFSKIITYHNGNLDVISDNKVEYNVLNEDFLEISKVYLTNEDIFIHDINIVNGKSSVLFTKIIPNFENLFHVDFDTEINKIQELTIHYQESKADTDTSINNLINYLKDKSFDNGNFELVYGIKPFHKFVPHSQLITKSFSKYSEVNYQINDFIFYSPNNLKKVDNNNFLLGSTTDTFFLYDYKNINIAYKFSMTEDEIFPKKLFDFYQNKLALVGTTNGSATNIYLDVKTDLAIALFDTNNGLAKRKVYDYGDVHTQGLDIRSNNDNLDVLFTWIVKNESVYEFNYKYLVLNSELDTIKSIDLNVYNLRFSDDAVKIIDDKIIIAGRTAESDNYDFHLAIFDLNGNKLFDEIWGIDGVNDILTHFELKDNKLYLAGRSNEKMYLAVLNLINLSINEDFKDSKIEFINYNELRLNIDNINYNNLHIEIVDYLGKTIINETINSNIINLNKLNSGVYFLKVSNSNSTILTKKFIKE